MSSLPRPAIATISLRLRRWYFRTALRLLFAEIRALGHRIRWILQIREVELRDGAEGVRLWMESLPVGGPCTHDYIVYMQQISARFPSLSIFDRLRIGLHLCGGSVCLDGFFGFLSGKIVQLVVVVAVGM